MKLEGRIEQLRHLRDTEPAAAADAMLRKALKDRSNLIVAEAAKGVGHLRRTPLTGDLLYAYDRLFDNPVKVDPKCWGKTAIVKALTSMDYSESPPFLRGARHIQMEPVWGGQEDAAMNLSLRRFRNGSRTQEKKDMATDSNFTVAPTQPGKS